MKTFIRVKNPILLTTALCLGALSISSNTIACNIGPNQLSDYTIQQESSGRYLDAGGSGNGYSVVTRNAQGDDSQIWEITCVGDVMTLQQEETGRYLDAFGENGDYFAVTRTEQNNDTQLWVNYYDQYNILNMRLMQLSSNLYLDAYENSGNDYKAVVRPFQDNDSQVWHRYSANYANGLFVQQSTDRNLDAYTAGNYSAATREGQGDLTQNWIRSNVGNVYTIQQKSSGRYLDAYTSSSNDYSAVLRTAQTDLDNHTQRWMIIEDQPSGTFTIQQIHNSRHLDAYQTGNDFNVVTRNEQNDNSQRWIFTPVY